ncbi:TPA: ABC transporter permease [Escherichia coli]|uniref:ABC transporter permease n=1 Tax=Escherichia coli TaxID=562 RepID=UPI000BE6A434|nr:ABC transporter permease [Escherichia coli]HAY3943268.1 ABC transporter permease [Escherichia coli]
MFFIIFLVLRESLKNIQENKSMMYLFSFILVLSFTGIIITDSLINSVAKTAQSELRSESESTVKINFYMSKPKEKIEMALAEIKNKKIFFSKKIFFQTGKTPFSSQLKMVIGVEPDDIMSDMEAPGFGENGENVVIIQKKNEYIDTDFFYINGIPFKINGVISKKATKFLDSLGLSSMRDGGEFFIPLTTASRLTLNNDVDGVKIIFNEKISELGLEYIKELLNKNNIDNYHIISFVDAKKSVDNVLEKFSFLTNIMYVFLTTTAIITTKSMSKKVFQHRSTEFALKMLNGIDGKLICISIFIESAIVALFSLLISFIVSFSTLSILANLIAVELVMRYNVLMMSVLMIVSFLCVYNIKLTFSLLTKELSTLIKERFS